MSQCPGCGADLKTVPAGISKSTGKPYDSFISCSNRCGWKPTKETGVKKILVENGPLKTPDSNGLREKTMVMSYAKDIVVAQLGRDQVVGEAGKETIAIFRELWGELSNPLK